MIKAQRICCHRRCLRHSARQRRLVREARHARRATPPACQRALHLHHRHHRPRLHPHVLTLRRHRHRGRRLRLRPPLPLGARLCEPCVVLPARDQHGDAGRLRRRQPGRSVRVLQARRVARLEDAVGRKAESGLITGIVPLARCGIALLRPVFGRRLRALLVPEKKCLFSTRLLPGVGQQGVLLLEWGPFLLGWNLPPQTSPPWRPRNEPAPPSPPAPAPCPPRSPPTSPRPSSR